MMDRQKLLIIGLAAVVFLWQGPGIVSAVFLDPIRERQNRIDLLQKSIQKKSEQKLELAVATSKLQNWNLRSLPPDPMRAASAYQVWLIDLGTKSGIANPTVAPPQPEARPKDDTYFAVRASVRGQGTLSALSSFLHKFHESGLLHRVLMVKADATRHEGDPVLTLQVDVEALSMIKAPERPGLFAKSDKPLVSDRPLKPQSEYASLTRKNPFVRGYNGPPRPPTPPIARRDPEPSRRIPETKDPPFDAAEHTYLISYFSSGDVQEVWLYDRSKPERTILGEGGEFEIGSVKGRVILIADDYVQILKDGELWELGLGKNLREMIKVPKMKKSEVPSSKGP